LTDPGLQSNLLEGFHSSIADLCKVVQGVTIHIFWAEGYGISLPLERQVEVQLRSLKNRLVRMMELDSLPLTEMRPIDRKIVGNCRDFSLMLV
jgi:hypothetical protein